jgi:phage tail-like protein
MPEQKDPLISGIFGLEFQGQLVGGFRECSGLGSSNEVVDYKASGPKGEFIMKKVPGRMSWSPITLRRGVSDAMDLWKWRKLVEQGKIDDARKNGSIVMHNLKGEEIARWNFVAAWPSKITGPAPNANTNEIAIEEIEIVHEGYERIK